MIENKKYRFYDVSGLKYHRMRWIAYFDNVNAVLFVTDLSAYDQNLVEDASINRMKDALELYKRICDNIIFENTFTVLFLNKVDIYEKKVLMIPIALHFPDYTGTPCSRSEGKNFFQKLFFAAGNSKRDGLRITHFTCCTDTKSIKVLVFSLM